MRTVVGSMLLAGLVGLHGCAMGAGEEIERDVTDTALLAPSGCPTGPEGMDQQAIDAMETMNRLRKTAGLGCVSLSREASVAAERHCQYYVANSGKCIAKPHREMDSCRNYMAETFSDRLAMSAYTGSPRFEVMAYVGHGPTSVQQWLDSVWHRIPILSPDVDEAGYGRQGRCDTMDFGFAGPSPTPKNLVYPLENQLNVPRSFSGRESPEPPPPPGGWPSGYPVTVYAAGLTDITEHSITVAETGVELDHIWLAPGDARAYGLLVDEFMLYTYRPLPAHTKFRVRVAGTQNGEPKVFDWTFTTR
ncbi:MAG TPA: CAP domain-containing protein [Polyangia bacterium]